MGFTFELPHHQLVHSFIRHLNSQQVKMQDCGKKKMKLESILRKLKKKENEKYKKKQAEVDKLQSKKIKLLEENEILEICIAANIKILRIRMEKLEEKDNWINAKKNTTDQTTRHKGK